VIHLLDKSCYAVSAFIALWASAVLDKWSMQLLVLAVILGLKWVLGSSHNTIQIFMQKKDNDDEGVLGSCS
jgi:hypothetical protein